MLDDLDFDHLLIGAAESPPESRIEFRDPIARHGARAVEAMRPWLEDGPLTAFAIRVIRKAADFGGKPEAIDALRASLPNLKPAHLGDARAALAELGARETVPRVRHSTPPSTGDIRSSNDLVVGRVYKRKDLHDSGLGGNRQKGISYGANSTEALLFSNPSAEAQWGYRDTWHGPDVYRYYGEWSGSGDMTFSGGNQAIVDRSPELHLFTRTAAGHMYAGRFTCRRWELVPGYRDNHEWTAIVFELVRA